MIILITANITILTIIIVYDKKTSYCS